MRALISLLVAALLVLAAPAVAQSDRLVDRVARELRGAGYEDISAYRTLLGRIRIVAETEGARREIVIEPSTGAILRDYTRRTRPSDDGGSSFSGGLGGGAGQGSGGSTGGSTGGVSSGADSSDNDRDDDDDSRDDDDGDDDEDDEDDDGDDDGDDGGDDDGEDDDD